MESADYEGALQQSQAAYDLMLGGCCSTMPAAAHVVCCAWPAVCDANKPLAPFSFRTLHHMVSMLAAHKNSPACPALLCPTWPLLGPAVAAAAYFGPDSADAAFHGIRLGISLVG
jgi:hypothetical protein